MRGIDFEIVNPRLKKLIAFRRLDRAHLATLASRYFFPVELLDCLDDFLELKLLEILIANSDKELFIEPISVECRSTNELKHSMARKEPNPIYLADEFMCEYFDRIATPMSDRQLKFYDQLFSKIQ
jgi:hypothetical protein